MRRIGIKTGIRTVALALIALPEPATTALGILILLASLALFRRKSLSKFGNLELLAQRSLYEGKPVDSRRDLGTEPTLVNHFIKLSLTSQPKKIKGQSKQSSAQPLNNSWFDNRQVSRIVLYHTLKTSFPQYQAAPEPVQKRNLEEARVIEHHKLKLSLVPEMIVGLPDPPPNKSVAARHTSVLHHKLDAGKPLLSHQPV